MPRERVVLQQASCEDIRQLAIDPKPLGVFNLIKVLVHGDTCKACHAIIDQYANVWTEMDDYGNPTSQQEEPVDTKNPA